MGLAGCRPLGRHYLHRAKRATLTGTPIHASILFERLHELRTRLLQKALGRRDRQLPVRTESLLRDSTHSLARPYPVHMIPTPQGSSDTDSQGDTGSQTQWLRIYLRQCQERLRAQGAKLEQLHAAVAEVEADCARISRSHDEAQKALDSALTLENQVRHLQNTADQLLGTPRLQVVPDQAAHLDDEEKPAAPPLAPHCDPASEDCPDEPISVGGTRSRMILDVLATAPDREWTASEVTAMLGEPEKAGRKRVRTGLDNLCGKGILEKIHGPRPKKIGTPGDSHVAYRIVRAWRLK